MTKATENYPSKFEMFFYNKVEHLLPKTLIISFIIGLCYGTAASVVILFISAYFGVTYRELFKGIAMIYFCTGFILFMMFDTIERYECANNIPAHYEQNSPFARAATFMIGFGSGFAMQFAYPYILAKLF